jgi:hypothetical protein
MKIITEKRFALLQRADFMSPRDMVQRAFAISGLYLLVHLAGFREYTGILNGTIGSIDLGWKLSGFLAGVYILLYLAFVLLVPVLLMAAAILTVEQRIMKRAK